MLHSALGPYWGFPTPAPLVVRRKTISYNSPDKQRVNSWFADLAVQTAGPIMYLEADEGNTTRTLLQRGAAEKRLVAVSRDPEAVNKMRRQFPNVRAVQAEISSQALRNCDAVWLDYMGTPYGTPRQSPSRDILTLLHRDTPLVLAVTCCADRGINKPQRRRFIKQTHKELGLDGVLDAPEFVRAVVGMRAHAAELKHHPYRHGGFSMHFQMFLCTPKDSSACL